MPPVNRKQPVRAKSSESQFSLMEFMREYPDDEACLNFLWRARYSKDGKHAKCPKCGKRREFRRYEHSQQRQSWTCVACGLHVASDRRDDLPQVVHVAASVVLRDVPHDEHSLRYLREAV